MIKLKQIYTIHFVLVIFLFNFLIIYNETQSVGDAINNDSSISSESVVTINDFTDFSLVNDNSHITSFNFEYNIPFSYIGANTEWMDDY